MHGIFSGTPRRPQPRAAIRSLQSAV